MTSQDVHHTITAIWRIESAKLIGALVRMLRDVDLAEDVAQEALVVALERWPEIGIPEQPGAWLMTTAKRKAIDYLRRNKLQERKYEQIVHETDREMGQVHELEIERIMAEVDGDVGDDLLRLIFTTCHPVLSQEARVALTLRLFGGLTTEEIAHAYFVSVSTVAQRIVRAKRTLKEARVPIQVPEKDELDERIASVLEVIYLMYNEGYTASSGSSWMRPTLCFEALRLGRILAEIIPAEPEVHGLVALMEIQSSRFRARVDAEGEPILLMDQNRALWDYLLIRRGLNALDRALEHGKSLGPYTLQASIAACHARARTASETDWVKISALYDALAQVTPSPVIELNRAVALSRAFGAEVGLEIVEGLIEESSLQDYYLLPSVHGDFLQKLGRMEEAAQAFKQAASLTQNTRERDLLLRRASACISSETIKPQDT